MSMWCFQAKPDLKKVHNWCLIEESFWTQPGSNTAVCSMRNLDLSTKFRLQWKEKKEVFKLKILMKHSIIPRSWDWVPCLDVSLGHHFPTSRDNIVVSTVQVIPCSQLAALRVRYESLKTRGWRVGFFNFGSGMDWVLEKIFWVRYSYWYQILSQSGIENLDCVFVGFLPYFPYFPLEYQYIYSQSNMSLVDWFGPSLAPTGALYAIVVYYRSSQPFSLDPVPFSH